MARNIRMLEDREGSPNHTHVFLYREGEIYSESSIPAVSPDLVEGFIASGHAIEVDEVGNPIAKPAEKRATKPAGPLATKADVATSASETEASGTAEAVPPE